MTSRQKLSQAGFTLVELAIVLLIVGLLIAGILKGQQLIENSRMTATIQQTKSYEAAVNTFRDSYGGAPGDLVTATNRVPGCVTGTTGCASGDGNGTIGAANDVAVAASALNAERAQFWLHLALANLITGVAPNQTAPNNTAAWGTTLPAGRINGGFLVGQGSGQPAGAAGVVNGHYIVLQGVPNATPGASGALSPDKAAQFDLKLDDGAPATGDVIAFGTGTCFTAGATGTYVAATGSAPTCAVATRIMN